MNRLASRLVMRAIRVNKPGGSEVLKLETNVPIPVPTDTQVLVEVKAAGINPIDTYLRTGIGPYATKVPYTPGKDGAGIVKQVGAKVTKFKPGDRVYVVVNVSGGYAEYSTAEENMVHILDEKFTFSQGAAIGVSNYTAYRALFIKAREKAQPGNTVLIHGASGGVGIACVQLGVAKGLKVFGTAGSKDGLDFVLKQGATAVFNHREQGYIDKIMEATNGEGPDAIIEMLANVNLQNDLQMIKRNGIIVVIGSRANIEITPRIFMHKECITTGMSIFSSPPEEWSEIHAGIAEGLKAGWLVPHIGQEYSLKEASKAHDDLINTTSALGKKVFVL